MGTGSEGEVFFSEEDLESHIHILGATGEGKSKFLELLCRQNINNGYGCCLIDPSDNGDTCYKVLKYALKQGYEKIVLIDPHDIKSRVPVINPLHYNAPFAAVVGNLMDAMRVLWGQSSFTDTPRIQKYLPAVLTTLLASKKTLSDVQWFLERDYDYAVRRIEMLEALNPLNISRKHLEAVFASKAAYVFEPFQSTINRLQPFTDPILKKIFGSTQAIDFKKLIKEKYIVLVNLDPEGVWGSGSPEQRLLGTIIINEITYAISRLRNSGWRGVYYLYIDEAGDYATSKLSYILDKKRKSGLRLTLSHQRFDQFSDKDVSSAVYGGTKIKVLFNTPSRDDRDKMIKMMFGGELSDRQVSYHLQDTPKQNCWIKNNKQKPVKARIKDLPDIDIKPNILKDYKTKIYSSDLYKSVEEIRAEQKSRFVNRPTKSFRRDYEPRQTKPDTPLSPAGQVSDDKPTSPADAPKRGWKDIKTAFD